MKTLLFGLTLLISFSTLANEDHYAHYICTSEGSESFIVELRSSGMVYLIDSRGIQSKHDHIKIRLDSAFRATQDGSKYDDSIGAPFNYFTQQNPDGSQLSYALLMNEVHLEDSKNDVEFNNVKHFEPINDRSPVKAVFTLDSQVLDFQEQGFARVFDSVFHCNRQDADIIPIEYYIDGPHGFGVCDVIGGACAL